MGALIRRFVIGWVLVRLARKFAGGNRSGGARR